MFKEMAITAHKSTEALKEFIKVYNEEMNKEQNMKKGEE